MRHASLTPLFDADARAAFEMLAGTAGLGSAPERQALLPRYARYYVALSRLPRRARRALQRRWRRSLAAIALLLALGQGAALAAVLTVGPDIAPDIVPDGSCALIEAMENANADAQTHADCLSGSGADTIALPASSTQLLIDVHNSTYGDNGLPVINSAITIEGNGSTIMREAGADLFRIFAVSGRGDLTLNETTVSRGFADGGDGGGIENRGGAVTLTDSTVFANGAYYRGGGVENDVDSTLTLTNSTVSNNYGFRGRGGGVYNGGTATLTNSTISGNSTFELGGGGVSNYGALTLTNSTISGNSATTYGGGVYNGGTLILARSLLSGNTALNGAEIYGGVIADNFNLFGHSGITRAQAFSGFSPGANDLTASSDGTTPTALGAILVGTLADNGGPTKTHALAVGSPAIDTSPADNDCQPTDQRGIGRPQGINCDIGAFEGTPSRAADLAISLTDSPDPVTINQPLIYTIKVRNYGPSLARGVQITDNLPEGVVLNFKPPECAGTTTVTCNLGPLASGAETTVTIGMIPTLPGTVSNMVVVLANPDPDPNLANNSATEMTTVREPLPDAADLAVTAAATPDPGASGQPLTHTVTVRNNGPQAATGVQLTDSLPNRIVLDGPPAPSQGDCRGTGPVTCNLGTLSSGTEASVTIYVIPTAAGILTNRATINLNQIDPDSSNNAASTTTTVEPPLEPTSQATCTTVRCALRLACNQAESLGDNCENYVTLVVNVPAARLNSELQTRKIKPIRFATAITNVPPGRTKKVTLQLTPRGKQTTKQLMEKGKRKLRGALQIRNAVGGIDTIGLKVTVK